MPGLEGSRRRPGAPGRRRRGPTAAGLAALGTALVLTACTGAADDAAEPPSATVSDVGDAIALVGPVIDPERDRPVFAAAVERTCGYDVLPAGDGTSADSAGDASADSAAAQQEQVDAALARGVDAIVLDAVDPSGAADLVRGAQEQDVPVVAYRRPLPDQLADHYVGVDPEALGAATARSLLDALADRGVTGGGLLQVSGPPDDPGAASFGDGVASVVGASGYEVLAELDVPPGQPDAAQTSVGGQLSQFGDQVVGVLAADDAGAGGSIAAFESVGLPVPPVTGGGADLAAVQRVVAGTQTSTTSTPVGPLAEAAAEVACALARGAAPEAGAELDGTPAQFVAADVVTPVNLRQVVVDGGVHTAQEICTTDYAEGCAALGIG